ncbi:hypothetical protein IWW34DRAFT_564247, partial [Fusarium oxysporum f. sp. albedinis]
GNKTFAEGVLKIERCGPKEYYLIVIDVPGFFKTTNERATAEENCELVKRRVKDYIRDSRKGILAVVPCNIVIET